MKALILICLASVSLLSCQKKYCWECTFYADGPGLGYNSGASEIRQVCDKTQKQVDALESYENQGKHYNLRGCEKKQ